MSAASSERDRLTLQLERIGLLLEERRPDGARRGAPARDDVTDEDLPASLRLVCRAFGLSPFERDVLLLCAGVELDATIRARCASAQGDPLRTHPTFELALSVLPGPSWGALSATAPLRRHHLVEVSPVDGLARSPLHIDERVLLHLTGHASHDPRLQVILRSVPAPGELPPSHRAHVDAVVALWSRVADPRRPPVQVCGADPRSRQAIAAAAAGALGLALHAIDAADLPHAPGEREALRVLWEREAVLLGGALLIGCEDQDGPESLRAARWLLERAEGPIFVSAREPIPTTRADVARVFVQPPTMAEQRALWLGLLGPLAERLDGQLERFVSHFNLSRAVVEGAIARCLPAGDAFGQALWEACRQEARPGLDDLAQRIEPCAGWDDLILPGPQKESLRQIAAQQRRRATVYEAWGFAEKGRRGLGTSALFSGASGTGKTMAAEVLAAELGLDLCRVDLSQVVSKYIGETEKNLRRVFDAAESGSTILLFDEADALFGKRSEVKDSHDRHANVEVSYLLQRMEAYRGLAILTTNMKSALDPAFLRRLRFVVDFPFPGAPEREEIRRRAFPRSTPTAGLDPGRLARVPIAGGNIRNIALNAAFLAADAGEPVRMRHLAAAARSELLKLDRPLGDGEIGGWT